MEAFGDEMSLIVLIWDYENVKIIVSVLDVPAWARQTNRPLQLC